MDRYQELSEQLVQGMKSKDIKKIIEVMDKIDQEYSPDEIPPEDRDKLAKTRALVQKTREKNSMIFSIFNQSLLLNSQVLF